MPIVPLGALQGQARPSGNPVAFLWPTGNIMYNAVMALGLVLGSVYVITLAELIRTAT